MLVYAKTCRARSSLGGVSVDTTSMRDNISHVVDETAMAEVGGEAVEGQKLSKKYLIVL